MKAPHFGFGLWLTEQSVVRCGCQRALNKLGDVVRDVDTALMFPGQEYRYNSIHVRPRGPRSELSRHAHRQDRPSRLSD